MGGKHKQAQRTKNNARPSSSGRSAELLGNSTPTFVGFTAVKDGGFAPILPGFSVTTTEELDPNLNPNFHLVLKKMGKKDSTTKLKALQEFSELIRNSEPEAVKAVLPLWPRLYCHLAVDVEHRVREAAHQAHRAVVLRAKRNLAPYLRQLAGPWFTSQYDTYPPAASAASLAFQDAFPPNKVIEAIIFCQEEILNYITDNLIVQTAQTLSNPKVVTAEEMEAKYQRVVISSLQGYAFYLHKLPAEQLQNAQQANKKIISSKKFWKFSKHTSPSIRSAWFSVIIALCEKAPDLLTDEGAHVALAVFNNLDEADPTVLPIVWEASLHILATVQDCWKHVSAEKLVLPKLWHILRDGGQGNAATIFPNLLPFLSKIPPAICSDKKVFYDKFFDNIRHGMSQKSVMQSASECNAVSRCYIECLRYIVMLHLNDETFCRTILQNHLIAAVQLMLKEEKLHLVSSTLFPQVSGLISHWNQNEAYTLLVELFWNHLKSVLLESLCLSPDSNSSLSQSVPTDWLLSRHVELCLCLRNPNYRKYGQRRQRVKFKFQEKNIEDMSSESEGSPDVTTPTADDVEVDEKLQALVEVICASFIKKMAQCDDPIFLQYLSKLIQTFESRELFLSLLKKNVSEDRHTESEDSLVDLFDSVLYKWLQNERMCTVDVVEITFSLFKFLTSSEKNYVLEALCKVSNGSVLVWCVRSSLECRSDPVVQAWLHSDHLRQILVSLTREICSNPSATQARHILKCCLAKGKDGDLVISPAAFADILSEFCHALSLPSDEPICLDFAMELVMSLYGSDLMLSPFLQTNEAAEELLVSLFRRSCQNNKGNKHDLNNAWYTGISALARLHGNNSDNFLKLTLKFAEVVKKELLTRKDVPVDHIVATVVTFLSAAVKCFPTNIEDKLSIKFATASLCVVFLNCLSTKLAVRQQNVTVTCLYAEQLKGLLKYSSRSQQMKLINLKRDDEKEKVDSEVQVVEFIILALFSVTLISKLSDIWDEADQEENCGSEQGDVEGDTSNQLSISDVKIIEEHLISALYSIAVCESFTKHYKSSIYYYKITPKYSTMNERFKLLMNTLDDEAIKYVTQVTTERAMQCGGLWTQAVYFLYTTIMKESDLHDLFLNMSEIDSIGTLHMYQVFPSYIKVEHMKTDMATMYVSKLTLVTCWLNHLEGTVPLDYTECILSFLNSILIWYQQDNKEELLYDCKVSWPQAETVVASAMFLSAVVKKCPELLTTDHWDVIIISLASWALTIKNSQKLLLLPSGNDSPPLVPSSTQRTLTANQKKSTLPISPAKSASFDLFCPESHSETVFAVAVFQLYNALMDFLTSSQVHSVSDVMKFRKKLSLEWKDVFASDVYEALLSTFYSVTGMMETCSLSLLDLPLLETLGEVMLRVDSNYFLPSGSANNAALDAMMKCCCKLISSSVIPLQFTAYHMMSRLAYVMVELDTPAAFAAAAADKEGDGLSVAKLEDALQQTQTVVDTMLMGIRLGDSCTVCPFTDAYTYTSAYLLLWAVILEMCGLAVSELRYQYAAMLRNSGFLKSLLQNVFRLMPEQVLQATDPKFKVQKTSEMFASAPPLLFSQASGSERLEHLSCWVYCVALRRLPALVRQWWSDTEPRVASLVEQVTSTHCTPLLCSEEMKVIQGKDTHYGNMLVKVHPTVREVVAVYKVDEARMELSIQLPSNYPLGSVRVESGKQLVDSGQWRNWMMQLTVFLTHQNGSIWDGLVLWKSNLDKRFEGVEECYICFSILHGSNFQIPRQCCSTCKKKFHSPCLYKWFSTSNKATCPICRNLF